MDAFEVGFAESVGFEPTEHCYSTLFHGAVIDHSTNLEKVARGTFQVFLMLPPTK
jgi:hypothetical protein